MIASLFESIQDIPRLEVEILLADTLKVPRSYLYAWPDRALSFEEETEFLHLLQRRRDGEPIAYITGTREFWSLDFFVTPDTLIPRHETETLVEWVLDTLPPSKAVIADLGVGSGAIAVALAAERPAWEIHAVDSSEKALRVARKNALHHGLFNILFHQGSWFDALPSSLKYDALLSNPPYLDKDDVHLDQGDLRFEPKSALISESSGLADLSYLIHHAPLYLKPKGYLFLEHGENQAETLRKQFQNAGYTNVMTQRDLSNKERVTRAIKIA